MELQAPPEAHGLKPRSLRLYYRYHLNETPKIIPTDLVFGVAAFRRGGLLLYIWDNESEEWAARERTPRWDGTGSGRPIRHGERAYANTEDGLKHLVKSLLRTHVPDPDDPRPESEEFMPNPDDFDSHVPAGRGTPPEEEAEPGPHSDILSDLEMRGPEVESDLGSLLSQFDCLPLREGPYTGAVTADLPSHAMTPEGRVFVAFSAQHSIRLEALNIGLWLDIHRRGDGQGFVPRSQTQEQHR